MCGRFANAQPLPEYARSVRHQLPPSTPAPRSTPDIDSYRPSHNVAPQTRAPVVRRQLPSERRAAAAATTTTDAEAEAEAGKDEVLLLQPMKWGLVRSHNKHPPSGPAAYRTINARDDTILSAQGSMWAPLLPSHRCVVFCQGFYEWQKKPLGPHSSFVEEGEKVERIPHFVGMADEGTGRIDKEGRGRRLMPLAALWDRVVYEGEEEPLYTFTIITTSVNPQLGFLHDRMPVILPDGESIVKWLGLGFGPDREDTWTPEVARLLRPLERELECYKVPREVGKVGNDDAGFILPIEERKDGLKAFFNKQQQQQQQKRKGGAAMKEDPTSTVAIEATMRESESFERAATAVADQVEEEAAMVNAAAKVEQEEQDRALAEQLQRQWEGDEVGAEAGTAATGKSNSNRKGEDRAASLSPGDKGDEDEIAASQIGDGFAVPRPSLPSSVKRQHSSSSSPSSPPNSHPARGGENENGSSRFSPNPFDPPLSPPRPNGGYSRTTADGGTMTPSPRKRTKFTALSVQGKVESGPIDGMLQRQREKAAVERSPTSSSKGRGSRERSTSGAAQTEGKTSPAKSTRGKGQDIRSFFNRK